LLLVLSGYVKPFSRPASRHPLHPATAPAARWSLAQWAGRYRFAGLPHGITADGNRAPDLHSCYAFRAWLAGMNFAQTCYVSGACRMPCVLIIPSEPGLCPADIALVQI
jgi:hypothetical protein